jgi:hypothetical protein
MLHTLGEKNAVLYNSLSWDKYLINVGVSDWMSYSPNAHCMLSVCTLLCWATYKHTILKSL